MTSGDVLNRIDNTLNELCPCGAPPRPRSPYCSDDCTPTHISTHTDQRMSGELATAMRWRPDLVTEHDDSDLVLLMQKRRGAVNHSLYRRRGAGLHFRVDDGNRFIGRDYTAEDASRRGHVYIWLLLERKLAKESDLAEIGVDESHAMTRAAVDAFVAQWWRQHGPGWHERRQAGASTEGQTLSLSGWDLAEVAAAHNRRIGLGSAPFARPRLQGLMDRQGPYGEIAHHNCRWPRPPQLRLLEIFWWEAAREPLSLHHGEPLLDGLVRLEALAALRKRVRSTPIAISRQRPDLPSSPSYAEAIHAAWTPVHEHMRGTLDAFARALLQNFAPAPTPPRHPMLAVIEARRHRNTGPQRRPRAPRQINPGSAR